MTGNTTIVAAGSERVDELRELFLAMHQHHRTVAALPLVEPDEAAWAARRATYLAWFAEERALLHLAENAGAVIGYALTAIHPGSDDTFALAPRYGAGVLALGGKLYVIGGTDNISTTRTVYVYDPALAAGSRWERRADMSTARAFLSSAARNSWYRSR